MTTWSIMSKAKADEIFDRESILYGDWEGIPMARAEELAGAEAMEWAIRRGQECKRVAVNGYGIGDLGTAFYLTRWGWYMVVTYHNVKETI